MKNKIAACIILYNPDVLKLQKTFLPILNMFQNCISMIILKINLTKTVLIITVKFNIFQI
jgi:hypothetical protein